MNQPKITLTVTLTGILQFETNWDTRDHKDLGRIIDKIPGVNRIWWVNNRYRFDITIGSLFNKEVVKANIVQAIQDYFADFEATAEVNQNTPVEKPKMGYYYFAAAFVVNTGECMSSFGAISLEFPSYDMLQRIVVADQPGARNIIILSVCPLPNREAYRNLLPSGTISDEEYEKLH